MPRDCVGCHESAGTVRVAGLGYVCALCAEVPGAVFEVEIERVNVAISRVQDAIDSIDGGTR